MSGQFTADLGAMQNWARQVMVTRAPDFIIGDNYLRRWWIIPRNDQCNVYLHEINRSDDDRALHCHPWDNTSWLLDGAYSEVRAMPDGDPAFGPYDTLNWVAGDYVKRKAATAHRLVIPDGGRAVSLFITGPQIREWGFHCPNGWRHWRDFTAGDDGESVGMGCD